MKQEPNYAVRFLVYLALAGAVVVLLWFFAKLGFVLMLFSIAIVISYLLTPFVDSLERMHVPRSLSILTIFIIFAGGVTTAVVVLTPKIVQETVTLADKFPDYADWLISQGDALMERFDVRGENAKIVQDAANTISDFLTNAAPKLATGLLNNVRNFFSSLPGLIIIPVLVFYFLKDVHKLRKGFLNSLPEHSREDTGRLLDRLNKNIGGFINGQIKLCVAMGLLAWFSMQFIAKLENAALMGVIAGVTEFIPYLGPILGMIMPLIVAAFIGWEKMLAVLIIFTALQLIENNLLAPRIMSEDVGMHPVIIIFILMSGAAAGGVVGMLVALPLAVMLKAFYEHFYLEKYILKPAAAGADAPVEATAGSSAASAPDAPPDVE